MNFVRYCFTLKTYFCKTFLLFKDRYVSNYSIVSTIDDIKKITSKVHFKENKIT